MKPQPSMGGSRIDPTIAPTSVRVIRTLGKGRAARAQLVEAVMPDGKTWRCVEKVFSPPWLTRVIYRLSFQSPFAYQSNQNAILACYYRRRVAAAVLAGSKLDVTVAAPLYVRFDETDRAWVLAAEWIDGRGIQPAAADASRIRRWLTASKHVTAKDTPRQEIEQLVDTMHDLENLFGDCGLVGSGWQVAPRALVSTANLLRRRDRYTIIDLESGIPAVLVPRYLIDGARRATVPPFDDLDAKKLRSWIDENERLLIFRIGSDSVNRLREDSEKLIEHSTRWKESELALLRRPMRLLTRRGIDAYQRECIRRWRQEGVVDSDTAASLPSRPIKTRLIWYAGLLPSMPGRFCSRLVGRHEYRTRVAQCLRSSQYRGEQWQQFLQACQRRWSQSGRLAPSTKLTSGAFFAHLALKILTPTRFHRFVADAQLRREVGTKLMLLFFSSRYQSWFGQNRIEASIDQWQSSARISPEEASGLRHDLIGNEVRVYTRGFGMHIALKATAPLIVPAKVGGIAAFFTHGSLWFLLPLLATPVMRTALTLANWFSTRHQPVPHGEALLAGLLPMLGSIAFPLQMFSTRPMLSTFLVREAASRVGRRIPVYGGADSRTEIALIRATDFLVELMATMSQLTQRVFPVRAPRQPAATIKIRSQTRFGGWIDGLAKRRINEEQQKTVVDRSERPSRAA